MADSDAPISPKQAATIAARFLAINPTAPRMLTTREADQVQTLIECLTASKLAGDQAPHPEDLLHGYWLERMLEAGMAISAKCYQRELELNGLAVQLQAARAGTRGPDELREQGAVLALLAGAVLSGPGNIREELIDRAGLRSRLEDLTAAIAELAPK